ncbi:hypothetical protein, partial [Burkholderia cepacia]|uniref:hypothetical protein n=1 Tax=Burkholderia cepacia TaxID=292 RepID=UPI0019552C7A
RSCVTGRRPAAFGQEATFDRTAAWTFGRRLCPATSHFDHDGGRCVFGQRPSAICKIPGPSGNLPFASAELS